jgi:hypothetical protein
MADNVIRDDLVEYTPAQLRKGETSQIPKRV